MNLDNQFPKEFETEGFLAKQFTDFRRKVREHFSDWIELSQNVNHLCQEALYCLDVKNTDVVGVAKVLLYLHILQIFQGIIMLLEHGMESQVIILLRSQLEALFKLKAIKNDANNVKLYGQESLLNQIKSGETVNELWVFSGNKHFTQEEIDHVRQRLRELKNEMKGKKYRILSSKEWAEKANFLEVYYMQYQLFCQPVHASANHLEELMSKDSSGIPQEFNPLPKFRMFKAYLHSAIYSLLTALECIESKAKKKKGKASFSKRRELISKKLNSLAKTLTK